MKKKILSLILGAALLVSCGVQQTLPTGSLQSTTQKSEQTDDTSSQTSENVENSTQESDTWVPTDTVKLIVAYKEGSSTDHTARLLAQYAEKYIGQPIEVVNIGANSGMTGWETLAAAEPDGNTIGIVNLPNIFTAIDNGGNFTMQDFAPIANHVIETAVVVVPSESPYYTLEDLINANIAANAEGKVLRCATNGVQASNDIGAALLAYNSGGWSFRHVSYGSTGDEISAMLSGECDWGVAKISDVLDYLDENETYETAVNTAQQTETAVVSPAPDANASSEQGFDETSDSESESESRGELVDANTDLPQSTHLRVLAVFNTDRSSELPDVPTLDELGYKTGWYGSTRGVVAPKGVSQAVIDFYADAFQKTLSDPDCIQAHIDNGLSLFYLNPDAFADRIDEMERFNQVLVPTLFS